ncbi:MAG: DUF2157 domain-containing protein [Cytophagaceae bacterium]|jgi:hypothetical protein|nr:DUF2157 domain-containing protein [Cytophagaceae bacterium]
MLHKHLAQRLCEKGLLSQADKNAWEEDLAKKPISVHWEFRTVLYLGVTLFSTGIGFLIYEHIDTIGHSVLIGLLSLLCVACLAYCFKKASPFHWLETANSQAWTDYILLLGCLLLLSVEGYLQYQYQVFGERYGLATMIPAFLFLFLAYRFDHKGVLSMAITGLAAWLGIATSPYQWDAIDTENLSTLYTALALGAVLSGVAFYSLKTSRKPHFFFTYLNFGVHIFFIACLSASLMTSWYPVYALLAAAASIGLLLYARKEHQHYFFLIAMVYGYIALSILFFRLIIAMDPSGDIIFWISFLYFFATCGAIIYFILQYKSLLKSDEKNS